MDSLLILLALLGGYILGKVHATNKYIAYLQAFKDELTEIIDVLDRADR